MPAKKPDSPILLALCLPALNVATPDVLRACINALAGSKAAPLGDDVQIVLAEAVNNIVEHAYICMGFGALALRISLTGQSLKIDLIDWGCPLPNLSLPAGHAPEPETLSEGGYGWLLIRSLVSTLEYQRLADSNQLSLHFDLC
ncbi:MAG: ATP-binding protein [Marivita sp.]|uniref:ATP-binding protein n=1 Tax=Marivita sp. TaxID=2003365 RepID=UPI001B22DEC4|nr:ATP-binding protein [Marivita sp.]MBO6883482.1 ATP-binding protein [Marivita sp.]